MDSLDKYIEPVREYLTNIKDELSLLNNSTLEVLDYYSFISIRIISDKRLHITELLAIDKVLKSWDYNDYRSSVVSRDLFHFYTYNIDKTKIESLIREIGLNSLINE